MRLIFILSRRRNICSVLSFSMVRLRLYAASLLLIAAGCTSIVRIGTSGDNVDRSAVESTIDFQLIPQTFVRNYTASPSKCPDEIDVSAGKVSQCSVTVDGSLLQVNVTYAGPPQAYHVAFDGSIYDMIRIERAAHANLMSLYGIDAAVQCGAPRLRTYSPGTSFKCAAKEQGRNIPLHFLAETGGGYHVSKPAGAPSAKTNWLSKALLLYAEHKHVVVSGDNIARFVDAVLSADLPATSINDRISPTQCSPFVDLTGGDQALCAASIEGQAIPYYVSIQPKSGLVATRRVAIIDNSVAAKTARNSVNARLSQAALPMGASVDCGSGLRVMAPGSGFECILHYKDKSAVVTFEVIDVGGTIRFTVGKLA